MWQGFIANHDFHWIGFNMTLPVQLFSGRWHAQKNSAWNEPRVGFTVILKSPWVLQSPLQCQGSGNGVRSWYSWWSPKGKFHLRTNFDRQSYGITWRESTCYVGTVGTWPKGGKISMGPVDSLPLGMSIMSIWFPWFFRFPTSRWLAWAYASCQNLSCPVLQTALNNYPSLSIIDAYLSMEQYVGIRWIWICNDLQRCNPFSSNASTTSFGLPSGAPCRHQWRS
jgi:hypothetical protein